MKILWARLIWPIINSLLVKRISFTTQLGWLQKVYISIIGRFSLVFVLIIELISNRVKEKAG